VRKRNIVGIAYLVVGLVVAYLNGFFAHLGTLPGIVSALLEIVLWPLALFGVNLHVNF
jgi:hypothetical protein